MKKRGAPTKLSPEWLEIARDVIESDLATVFMTDIEISDEINDRIAIKYPNRDLKVSYGTFKRWKSKSKHGLFDSSKDKLFCDLCSLIKKAQINQKRILFHNLLNDRQWKKWAWIIERRYDEWNLRKINRNLNRYGLNDRAEKPAVVLHL